MGGVAVLAAVKKDPALHAPVVVFVTSDHSETRRQRVLEAGAAAYLHKPVDPERLGTCLREVVPALAGGGA
jgi:CheY-like chemotaxis protein